MGKSLLGLGDLDSQGVPVGGEPAVLGRDPGHDLEVDRAVAGGLADQRGQLGRPADDRPDRLPNLPPRLLRRRGQPHAQRAVGLNLRAFKAKARDLDPVAKAWEKVSLWV